VFDDEALTVLVLNVGERGSAKFTIAPGATPDDGLLDVVVVRGRRRALMRAGLARVRGRVPRDADAVLARGSTIEVRWDRDVAVQCDGDAFGRRSAVTYTVEPSAVAVRA
jgi:diacylglycerol kinase (ATP)